MPAIETHQLEREFKGGLKAVRGIDLAIEEGEVYGFLGPNGAGKTTTVRILVTLLRPTAGKALVAGHDVAHDPYAVRQNIGVALQEAALDNLMTGRELVELQAKLHGIPSSQTRGRSAELIERVDLSDAQDRRVGTYSGGMRRRLDLAMALVHSPKVLFLDEPTTGLDPVSRLALWEEVKRLRNEGTTVFLTTQYLEEADELADRVGIIDRGQIVAEGTPTELKSQVGSQQLEITIGNGEREAALEVLSKFGQATSLKHDGSEEKITVALQEGATQIAPIVRALDEKDVSVESLELVQPSLDDVFIAKTGHSLEGDGESGS